MNSLSAAGRRRSIVKTGRGENKKSHLVGGGWATNWRKGLAAFAADEGEGAKAEQAQRRRFRNRSARNLLVGLEAANCGIIERKSVRCTHAIKVFVECEQRGFIVPTANLRGAFIDALEDIATRAGPIQVNRSGICTTDLMCHPIIPRGSIFDRGAAALVDSTGGPDDVVATDPAGVGEVNGVCDVVGAGINQLPSYGVAIQQGVIIAGQIRCLMGISTKGCGPVNPVSGIGGGGNGQCAECDE